MYSWSLDDRIQEAFFSACYAVSVASRVCYFFETLQRKGRGISSSAEAIVWEYERLELPNGFYSTTYKVIGEDCRISICWFSAVNIVVERCWGINKSFELRQVDCRARLPSLAIDAQLPSSLYPLACPRMCVTLSNFWRGRVNLWKGATSLSHY